jgi:hypothetical protein
MHIWPNWPQTLVLVPGWQAPVESQQPMLHVFCPHVPPELDEPPDELLELLEDPPDELLEELPPAVHVPPLHAPPVAVQFWQGPPPVPQAVSIVVATHAPV